MIRFLYKKYKSRQEEKAAAAAANTTDARIAADPVSAEESITATTPKALKSKKACHHQGPKKEAAIESADEPIRIEAPQAAVGQNGECLDCKAEKRASRIYRWKLIIALFPPQFLASVDTTIVATSLTTISITADQLQQFNWIVTAYTLTSTAFIPAYGQIADIFGRHIALQLSMAFMLIGSTLCAAAQTWGMLLFGRALQGLSAAGIMNMIKIVLSDKVSLAENSKNNTIFAFVGGISYAVGPIIGGVLSNSNWRYCFVISIHGTHHLTGPERKSFREGLMTIDFGGTFLFVVGACLLILGVTWGG